MALLCGQACVTGARLSPVSAVIRAKVVGKKLVKEGPFGTLVYTIKQMKVSGSIYPLQEEGSWWWPAGPWPGEAGWWGLDVCLSLSEPQAFRPWDRLPLRQQEEGRG